MFTESWEYRDPLFRIFILRKLSFLVRRKFHLPRYFELEFLISNTGFHFLSVLLPVGIVTGKYHSWHVLRELFVQNYVSAKKIFRFREHTSNYNRGNIPLSHLVHCIHQEKLMHEDTYKFFWISQLQSLLLHPPSAYS